jgi:hypothetical protein
MTLTDPAKIMGLNRANVRINKAPGEKTKTNNTENK